MNRRSTLSALLGLAASGAARADAGRSIQVLGTTDQPVVQPFIDDFERRHAGQQVNYVQLGSLELNRRFLADHEGPTDVLWSSAMDLQIKLVNDGHAARYESAHAPFLPRWAVWKHEAYGTTSEPIGVVYHRGSVAPAEVPRSHAALLALLRADTPRFRGRVATYDIERAGLGYLVAAHDALVAPRAWELVAALGACRASLHADTLSMLEGVAAGRLLLAYNVLGTYAEAYARRHPALGISYLQDYTLLTSRVAFIARRAPNPHGARLWLDHLLSAPGQQILADAGGLYGVRTDTTQAGSAQALGRRLGVAARPIALGPGLLAQLDRSKHAATIRRWRREFTPAG